MTWKKADVIHFDADITESGLYDVKILVRHTYGFPYADLHTEIGIEGPDHSTLETVSIPIIGDDKKYLGEGAVDLWDVEYVLYEKQTLEKGKYSVDIKHLMSQEEVKLLMEIGVMITKSEK
ncbi:MAG: hypothetical protein Salg2KO_16930 [Salibacteraceae bacterium]